MCGIIGILGNSPVAPRLVQSLKGLEYRGYDSAGVATLENGAILRRRAAGKLANLERVLAEEPLAGVTGIGHTRWATHGAPTTSNAHPHATGKVDEGEGDLVHRHLHADDPGEIRVYRQLALAAATAQRRARADFH